MIELIDTTDTVEFYSMKDTDNTIAPYKRNTLYLNIFCCGVYSVNGCRESLNQMRGLHYNPDGEGAVFSLHCVLCYWCHSYLRE